VFAVLRHLAHRLTGEELKEVVVKDITVAEKGLVTTHGRHNLESGDVVVFREVLTCNMKFNDG
jgi:hypothetical protein